MGLNFHLSSQVNFVSISGNVVSSYNNEYVANAKVHLRLTSGLNYELITDSIGHYEFKIKNDTLSDFEITIATDRITTSKSNKKSGFLATKDFGKGKLNGNISFVKNFELQEAKGCGLVFTVLFYKNSIISCNDSLHLKDSIYYDTFDDVCNLLYNSLKENPTMIIELQGHSSRQEKNYEELSLYRAHLIKEILVAKGINRRRIETKGWGNRKLFVKDEVIKKAKTNEEKNALHTKNQRVVFRILNWDFKE